MPLVAATLATTLAACSGGSSHKVVTKSTSVFNVQPGECFQTPKDVKTELSDLSRTSCSAPHTQESYAIVPYAVAVGTTDPAYPGNDALTAFAQGRCAQQFTGYVGVDYLDSSLFFTYLFPSTRGWEQDDDRKIVCFVTTTGAQLTASVKGSKK